jgi:hypothetical protein
MSYTASLVGTLTITDDAGNVTESRTISKKSVPFDEIARDQPSLGQTIAGRVLDFGSIGTTGRFVYLESNEPVDITDVNGTALGANDLLDTTLLICFGNMRALTVDMSGVGTHRPNLIAGGD